MKYEHNHSLVGAAGYDGFGKMVSYSYLQRYHHDAIVIRNFIYGISSDEFLYSETGCVKS
jgi:hypothetical protein